MRNFLLVMVFLNLLVFLYQSWIIEPDVQVDAFHIDQDFPTLVSADVPRLPSLPQPAPPAEPVPAEMAPERCMKMGPFASEADADTVRARLQASGTEVRQTSEIGQVWVGHWVQVTDQASRAMAEQTRDALRNAGIRDAYVLSGTDNRISLGVFRLRSSANGVVKQATSLGFKTRMDDRFQEGTNYWLQLRTSGNADPQLGELQMASGKILRIENLACADAGF